MDKCIKCGKETIGNSPTGSWCNSCGDQYPCPCDQNRYCPSHDINHKHEWIDGRCKDEDCPAKEKFQELIG